MLIPNPEASNQLVLNAITNAIDKHMKPTIIATNTKRKQIDRPYGESITSVDAYIKIQKLENARKKKSTKENNGPERESNTEAKKRVSAVDIYTMLNKAVIVLEYAAKRSNPQLLNTMNHSIILRLSKVMIK